MKKSASEIKAGDCIVYAFGRIVKVTSVETIGLRVKVQGDILPENGYAAGQRATHSHSIDTQVNVR